MPVDLAPADVARWRRDWEAMMGHYQPGRASLVAAGLHAVTTMLGRQPERILDLGGGPGTIAELFSGRWPQARVTVLDIDPVLLALAETALPERTDSVQADLSSPAWVARVSGPYDLIWAIMTTHYLPEQRLRRWYVETRRVLRPHGLLLVADTIPDGPPVPTTSDGRGGTGQIGHGGAEEPWRDWWDRLAGVASMAPLLRRRAAVLAGLPDAEFVAPGRWHRETASQAGFEHAGTLWRNGDQALVAFRATGETL
ncbi:class I SAM-dependent methyltransferase [Plantactinospora sp. WMMC1484]|uniref:class I SAM-dependent methyltransferase n=1 Tax=Plantactinospora sp. WMMC1484 TaxID=3404122 RepID=UPI003BF60920